MSRLCIAMASIALLASEPSPGSTSAGQKDLVAPARAAMNGFMLRCPDPVPGHPGMQRASFACMVLPRPVVAHGQWDWGDCTSRAIEAWFWTREMIGDTRPGEMERAQQAALLWTLVPDTGMSCVPDRSDPQKQVYHYQMWDQGRTLRALVHCWQLETDAARRDLQRRIDLMIAGLRKRAQRGHDPKYGDYAVYAHDSWTGEQPGDDLMCMRGGQLIEPLAIYWAETGSADVRTFLDELVAGVFSGHEGDAYADPAQKNLFAFGENGSFNGHFHVHASTALGVTRLGRALYLKGERSKGLELLRWSRRVYDWTLSPENVNAGSTWGWFPENVSNGNQSSREVSEICCVADMIEFAAVLAECSNLDPGLADWDALWDHVERYTLNSILPTQFFVTDAYRKVLKACADAQPGIDNGYVRFAMDPTGCFNHESAGYQTLGGASKGALSQAYYGVEYAGKRACFRHVGWQNNGGQGLVVREPTRRDTDALRGTVETQDGILRIRNEAVCGRGPYVIRRFEITNISQALVPRVRLALAVNLDWTDWMQNEARVDAASGTVTVTSSSEPGVMGVAAEPRATFVDVGDALQILQTPGELDWSHPRTTFSGNAAVALGWELGSLAAGETRSASLTLAVGANAAELDRALHRAEFPSRFDAQGRPFDQQSADRLAGSWYACFLPNDATGRGPDGLPNTSGMACCSYSGPRGLHACWKAAISDDGNFVSVRLPIDREDSHVSQQVREGPDEVLQRIRLKTDRSLRIRIPDWAQVDRVQLVSADATLPVQRKDRWLETGRLPASTTVTVRYPMVTRTTRERVGGSGEGIGFSPPAQKRTFTVTWQGNRVMSIDPPGKLLPLFVPGAGGQTASSASH